MTAAIRIASAITLAAGLLAIAATFAALPTSAPASLTIATD